MSNYPPDVQKRIDRYEKKGYTRLSYAECYECSNKVGHRYFKANAPIYLNPNSRYMFCANCGARWMV